MLIDGLIVYVISLWLKMQLINTAHMGRLKFFWVTIIIYLHTIGRKSRRKTATGN